MAFLNKKKRKKKLYFELRWLLLLSKITRLHEEAPLESRSSRRGLAFPEYGKKFAFGEKQS